MPSYSKCLCSAKYIACGQATVNSFCAFLNFDTFLGHLISCEIFECHFNLFITDSPPSLLPPSPSAGPPTAHPCSSIPRCLGSPARERSSFSVGGGGGCGDLLFLLPERLLSAACCLARILYMSEVKARHLEGLTYFCLGLRPLFFADLGFRR
jgi:hypothetical protein